MNINKTKKLATISMMCAVAFVVTLFGMSIMPSAEFLKLEFKDAIIVIAGFIYGPLASLAISIVVSVIEIPISGTHIVGCLMNILSSCSFALSAVIIYRKHRNIKGAMTGLASAVLIMTAVMVFWNYTMTPIYQGVPRNVIVDMLLPVFIPFNLIKGALNASIALAIYKPLTNVMRKAKLLPPTKTENKKSIGIGSLLIAIAIFITCIYVILMING